MSSKPRKLGLFTMKPTLPVLFLFVICIFAATDIRAATLTVTTTADTNDGVCDADCSLREAVAAAASGDTVVFSSLFNTPQTITLTLGQITIDKDLTITGTGQNLVTISGNNAGRIFDISGGVSVNVSGATFRDGNAGNGGAIRLTAGTGTNWSPVAEMKAYKQFIYEWEYPELAAPRHNLRPTEPAYIVARRGDALVKTLEARWWCQWDGAKKFEAKYPTFNARVETMHEKKLWPDLLKKGQRCIFPIDSFYEWPVKGKGLPPVEIFVAGRTPYALAGLWSRYFEGDQTRYSFTTFTCEPNEFMKPLHEKAMPVILNSLEEQKLWLLEGDEELLRPYAGEMEFDQLGDTLEQLHPEENRKY